MAEGRTFVELFGKCMDFLDLRQIQTAKVRPQKKTLVYPKSSVNCEINLEIYEFIWSDTGNLENIQTFSQIYPWFKTYRRQWYIYKHFNIPLIIAATLPDLDLTPAPSNNVINLNISCIYPIYILYILYISCIYPVYILYISCTYPVYIPYTLKHIY